MRIPLALGLLVVTASCEFLPPAEPPPPAAAAAPAPAPQFWLPAPLAWLFGTVPGRLILNNYSFDNAHVQTVVTGFPDCVPRPGTLNSDFILPLNGTRVIETMPGADVCWRRAVEAGRTPAPPTEPGWTEWNRAYTSSGRPIDSRL